MPILFFRFFSCAVLLASLVVAAAQAACVWQVKGERSTLYLAGSIHFLRSSDEIPAVYDRVYSESDLVVLEVEPHLLKTSGATQVYFKEGQCPKGRQIQHYLDAEINRLLEKRLQKSPHQAKRVRQMRPWMAAMALTVWELQRLGAKPERGIDHVYYHQARRDEKPTASLESPLTHVKLLASLSRQEQMVFLQQTLMTLDETEIMFDELLQAWQQGNEHILAEWFVDISVEEFSIMDKILLQRNQNWIKPLESYLQSDKVVMVIAGVGHMIGEGSLIDLFKKRGYNIRKLN
ncbi:MAG: TraB/GumN family protein [Verrucomicrobiota bacterium]